MYLYLAICTRAFTIFGAPIRFISYGVKFSIDGGSLNEVAAHWYEGFQGQMIGLVMLLILAVVCYQLAKIGAKWTLDAQDGEQ
jgi:uncharacterized membrane protein